jgi:hypothetical protein
MHLASSNLLFSVPMGHLTQFPMLNTFPGLKRESGTGKSGKCGLEVRNPYAIVTNYISRYPNIGPCIIYEINFI